MNFNNELMLSMMIYVLVIGYSMMNYYDFVTENPNMVIVVAMGAYYMVMRLKNM
jgi:hypothetical protein